MPTLVGFIGVNNDREPSGEGSNILVSNMQSFDFCLKSKRCKVEGFGTIFCTSWLS